MRLDGSHTGRTGGWDVARVAAPLLLSLLAGPAPALAQEASAAAGAAEAEAPAVERQEEVVVTPVDLKPYFPELPPEYRPLVEEDFLVVQRVLGKEDLKQESLTSYEIGYIGTLGARTTLGVNFYVNDTSDNINFTARPADEDPYTEADPPPGWELPPSFVSDLAQQGILFPRVRNQFLNLGPIRHKGLELFVEHRFSARCPPCFAARTWPMPRFSSTITATS